MSKKRLSSYIINFVIVLAVFIVLQLLISNGVISRYYGRIINLICINTILAVSLNLSGYNNTWLRRNNSSHI